MSTSAGIGGFFALHLPRSSPVTSVWDAWTKNASSVHTFRNARSALRHVLRSLKPRRVWLPAYACHSLAEGCAALGHTPLLYAITERFEPDRLFLRHELEPRDAVVVIDYFGSPPSADFLRWSRMMEGITWIEDRAQALHPGGDKAGGWADYQIFSPRKLLGVMEGGLAVSHAEPLPAPAYADALPQGVGQAALLRYEDPEGRYADTVYARYCAEESAMTVADLPMTRLSRAILESVDITSLIEARRRNYGVLGQHLADLALLGSRAPEYTPFGFPVTVPWRDQVAKALASRRMFVPVHWREILGQDGAFPVEVSLAARQLTLPCDHRYGTDEMKRLARAVLEASA